MMEPTTTSCNNILYKSTVNKAEDYLAISLLIDLPVVVVVGCAADGYGEGGEEGGGEEEQVQGGGRAPTPELLGCTLWCR